MLNKINTSRWIDEVKISKSYSPLNKNIECDVVIIGGGITGITSAYLLSKQGKKVALIEKSYLTSGITSYTTAFLTAYPDVDLDEIKKRFGKDAVAQVIQSGFDAIDIIQSNINDTNSNCDFKREVFMHMQMMTRDLRVSRAKLNFQVKLASR